MKNPKSPISLEKRVKNGASKSRKSVRKVSKTRSGNKGVATEGTRGVGMPPPPPPSPLQFPAKPGPTFFVSKIKNVDFYGWVCPPP